MTLITSQIKSFEKLGLTPMPRNIPASTLKKLLQYHAVFDNEYTLNVENILWMNESRCIRRGKLFDLHKYDFLLNPIIAEGDKPECGWKIFEMYSHAETGVWYLRVYRKINNERIRLWVSSVDILEELPEPLEEGVYINEKHTVVGYDINGKFQKITDNFQYNNYNYYEAYKIFMKKLYKDMKLDPSVAWNEHKANKPAEKIKERGIEVYEKRVMEFWDKVDKYFN